MSRSSRRAALAGLSAPEAYLGADARLAVARLQVPLLYLVAADDGGGGFAEDARALFDRTASTDKALEVVPGTAHGFTLVASPGRPRDLVEQFLGSH